MAVPGEGAGVDDPGALWGSRGGGGWSWGDMGEELAEPETRRAAEVRTEKDVGL